MGGEVGRGECVDDGEGDGDGAPCGCVPGPPSWIGIMPFGHRCGCVLVTYRALCLPTQACTCPAEFS